MAEIQDNSLKVMWKNETYIFNVTMESFLVYQKHTGHGIMLDGGKFLEYRAENMLDLIACMIRDKNDKEKILDDFVYSLNEKDKMNLLFTLSDFALTCFVKCVLQNDDEEENETEIPLKKKKLKLKMKMKKKKK